MAILFDFYQTPSPKGTENDESERFHARVVGGHTLDLDNLVKRICKRSTLTEGDIRAVVSELGQELVSGLCEGNRVMLPGIGYFSLTLAAPKECTPKHTHSQHVHIKNVAFRADQTLRDRLKEQASFERSSKKNHSEQLTEQEIIKLLREYFKENRFITRKEFSTLCQFTKTTALRHLSNLQKQGVLTNINSIHSPLYELTEEYR